MANVDRNTRRFRSGSHARLPRVGAWRLRSAFGRHCGYVTIRPLASEDSVLYFPPEAFGPFRVLHQIGAGTFGPVFRAYAPDGDRLVAVKVFRLDITSEQAAVLVRALEQLIARLSPDAALAAPIAAGLDGHSAYLATEYVVGDSLAATARHAPTPLSDVVPIVEAVAGALDRSASLGVHHERLHPRDIIMSANGPRVTGVGVAEALSSIGITLPARSPYAAPEGPSDVYALAAITYELISGRRMTPGGWDELSAEDGPELRNAFAAALAEDSRARPASAGGFAKMLREAARSSGFGTRDSGFDLSEPTHESRITNPGFEGGLDTTALDHFADLGAASDLQMEFSEP